MENGQGGGDYSRPNNGYPKSYNNVAISIVVSALLVLIVALVFVTLFVLAIKIYATLFGHGSTSPLGQHMPSGNTTNINSNSVRSMEMDTVIRMMPVFKYTASMKIEDGVEATECAVCLCEFEENDSARLLPQCKHIFHTQCIDKWFSSHSNCPLCRANLLPVPSPSPDPSPEPIPEHNSDVIIINVHVVHNPS